jgi:hypothetical protein
MGGETAFQALLDFLDEAEPEVAAAVEDALDRIQFQGDEADV